MKSLKHYLSKIKLEIWILVVFAIFFLVMLTYIDFKKNSGKEVVSVIGISEEKILKDAQFSLDYIIYGISEDDLKNKLDEKVSEIKSLVSNFDQVANENIEKKISAECVIDYRYRYQVQNIEEGKCLSNNWRGQARIVFSIKGEQYSDEIKKSILNLAPKIVNSASGPVFLKKSLDKNIENRLIEKAMKNAKQKAEKIAFESNKELGSVIGVDENPLVKDNLMSFQSNDKDLLSSGEDLIEKKILVNFELK